MTELTRRSLVTGSVAATAAAVIAPSTSGPVRAAAPPAGTQAPGWYRYKVGSFEITVVTDGVNRFKFPDNIVANAKREDVNSALAAYYYLRVVVFMYMREPEGAGARLVPSFAGGLALAIALIGIVLLGVIPAPFADLAQAAVAPLLR